MRKARRMLSLALCLAVLLAALPCALGEEAAEVAEAAGGGTRRLRLGTSDYTIEIDDHYVYGEVTEDDIADDQVAYLYSDQSKLDFDVYQFSKEGHAENLEDYVAEEAADYDAVTEIEREGVINDIPAAWYRTTEEYEGESYETITYILDNDDQYVEVVFWLDGADAEDEARMIIRTLRHVDVQVIRLGTSPYCVKAYSDFVEGELKPEDIADDMVAYWHSDETLLDFDVYQFSKEGLPQDLAGYATQEAGTDENVTELETDAEVNGIPVAWYRTTEEYEGASYPTLTCVLDNGDEFVEIVFWLDGLTAGAEADAILKSLWMEADVPEAAAEPAEEGAQATDAAEAPKAGEEDLMERIEALEVELAELKAELNARENASADAEPEEDEEPEENDEPEEDGESAIADAETGDDALADGVEPEGDAPDAETYRLKLGTSFYYMYVPVGFMEGPVSPEDIADDMVGYYYSDDSLLDFDVYQFSKEDVAEDLVDYAVEEASKYSNVTDLVTDGEINGITAAWYRAVEAYDGSEYETITYILDSGKDYTEVVFWLDGEDAEAQAKAIIDTLDMDRDAVLNALSDALFEAADDIEVTAQESADASAEEIEQAIQEILEAAEAADEPKE